MSLLTYVLLRLEFLTANMKIGLPDVEYRSMSDNMAKDIMAKVHCMSYLGEKEATALTETLFVAPLCAENKGQIAASLRSKVLESPGDAVNASSSSKGQILLHPENYLTETDWETIRNTSIHRSKKFDTVIKRLNRIGLKWMTEKTKSNCVSMVVFFEKQSDDEILMTQEFKSRFDFVKKKTDITKGPTEYPDTVDQFRQDHGILYDSAYSNDPPVIAQINERDLEELRSSLHSRAVKGSGNGRQVHSRIVKRMMDLRQQNVVLQHHVGRLRDSPDLEDILPGFTWGNGRVGKSTPDLASVDDAAVTKRTRDSASVDNAPVTPQRSGGSVPLDDCSSAMKESSVQSPALLVNSASPSTSCAFFSAMHPPSATPAVDGPEVAAAMPATTAHPPSATPAVDDPVVAAAMLATTADTEKVDSMLAGLKNIKGKLDAKKTKDQDIIQHGNVCCADVSLYHIIL